jgi:superfamily II DNA or RNA helicase
MKLRPYQQELVDDIKNSLKAGNKSVCCVLGCGGGKSIIQATICRLTNEKGKKVLFIVHRKELCNQIEDTFRACGVDFNLTHIGMVQTVTRRLDKMDKFDLILIDEAHRSPSSTYKRIFEYYSYAIRLGFTATPIRLNEGGLGSVFDDIVEGVSTEWLIENNYLAPYRYYAVKLADTSKLKTKRGDYDIVQVNELMEHTEIYAKTLENWEKICKDKKTIIYCSSIAASKNTIAEFKAHGYAAEHLDGSTDKKTRQEVMDQFRSGEVKIISNVELFGEGISVDDCECVILLRPTQSLSLFIQQSMRSMRYQEGKTAYILDLVNNVRLHGLPDTKRKWKLDAKKRIKGVAEVPIKICPTCFGACAVQRKECPYCGEILKQEEEEHKQAKKKEGELIEIRKKLFQTAEYKTYMSIDNFSDMVTFQQAKGYKFAWTIRKCVERKIEVPRKYRYMAKKYLGVSI